MGRVDSARGRGARALACLLIGASTLGCQGFGASGAVRRAVMNLGRETDPNERFRDYDRIDAGADVLDEIERSAAVAMLTKAWERGDEPKASRAAICRALGALGGEPAAAILRRAIDDPDPMIRASACRALGRAGNRSDVTLLARIMVTDPDPDGRIAAIDGLGALKSGDPRALDVLVDGMGDADPAIRLASYQALCESTGEDLGTDAARWREYADAYQAPAPSP